MSNPEPMEKPTNVYLPPDVTDRSLDDQTEPDAPSAEARGRERLHEQDLLIAALAAATWRKKP